MGAAVAKRVHLDTHEYFCVLEECLTDSILIALALVIVIEGLGPMLFTRTWRSYLIQLAAQPLEQLRTIGGVMVTIGLVSLYFLL